jgi:acetyl-CoA C-acetyltransferase
MTAGPYPNTHPVDVIIAGIGLTPVGEHWDISLRDLALTAISAASADGGRLAPQALYVANSLAPILSGQSQLGALLADFAGYTGIEATTVEAAGASGGAAVRQAFLAIRSGAIDTALIVGVEKVSDQIGAALQSALSAAEDSDYESIQGVTPTAQAALLMRRYLHDTGAPADALAGFSLVAHANGALNPNAMYRRAIKPEDYVRADMISEPVNMYDAAPVADGAAALLLARADALPSDQKHPRVRIAGSALATAPVALHDRPDPLSFEASRRSASQALQRAEIAPSAVDLFELHDLFTIYAPLALEAAGFANRGEGWKLAADGKISLKGELPLMTFGGSKARGDTGGATGVYQMAEVTLQLQGRAQSNQVPGARIGLAQCLAGIGGTAASHVLEALDAD